MVDLAFLQCVRGCSCGGEKGGGNSLHAMIPPIVIGFKFGLCIDKTSNLILNI